MRELVREEQPADVSGIHDVQAAAFGAADEARLVDRLRGVVRPFLSWVAEEDGVVIGHIVFTPVAIEGRSGLLLALGPLAVRPDRQRLGVGSRLTRVGLDACRAAKAVGVVVLGHPGFYPRFGFRPALDWGLRFRDERYDRAFFAIELAPGALVGAPALVRYHSAFDD